MSRCSHSLSSSQSQLPIYDLKTTRFAAFIVGLLGLGVLHATPVVESIQGQLVLTRVLTRQRVVLPEYSVRGVTPPRRPDTRIVVREWDRVAVYLEGGNPPKA